MTRHLLITLFAATVAAAQVPDGQELVRAALVDIEVYDVAPSGSMEPAFNETYWIAVRHLPWAELREGDRIVYCSAQPFATADGMTRLVVHQIKRRSSGGSVLLMQGLANSRPDPELITEDMYVGTVVAVIKKPR